LAVWPATCLLVFSFGAGRREVSAWAFAGSGKLKMKIAREMVRGAVRGGGGGSS
jgi:hypothetical protein